MGARPVLSSSGPEISCDHIEAATRHLSIEGATIAVASGFPKAIGCRGVVSRIDLRLSAEGELDQGA